jgi:hypothetical protein
MMTPQQNAIAVRNGSTAGLAAGFEGAFLKRMSIMLHSATASAAVAQKPSG